MSGRKPKVDLSSLPEHIKKKSKNWWVDSKTGKFIHNSNIQAHLPKPSMSHEDIIEKRYDLQRD